MKLALSIVFVFVVVFSVVFGVFFKSAIISLLMVEKIGFNEPDLIVVLEGGSIKFPPTYERVSEAVRAYHEYKTKILVCSIPGLKIDIYNYFKSNGIRNEDLIISEYTYDDSGGTYNNVNEIISVIKNNKKYKNIKIITSPYHELRVDIIFSRIFKSSNIDRQVNVSFHHVKNSEILKTDFRRYMRIIAHELVGIMVFKYTLFVRELY